MLKSSDIDAADADEKALTSLTDLFMKVSTNPLYAFSRFKAFFAKTTCEEIPNTEEPFIAEAFAAMIDRHLSLITTGAVTGTQIPELERVGSFLMLAVTLAPPESDLSQNSLRQWDGITGYIAERHSLHQALMWVSRAAFYSDSSVLKQQGQKRWEELALTAMKDDNAAKVKIDEIEKIIHLARNLRKENIERRKDKTAEQKYDRGFAIIASRALKTLQQKFPAAAEGASFRLAPEKTYDLLPADESLDMGVFYPELKPD